MVAMTPPAPAWGSQVPPRPSHTPAPAGTDSSPRPARLHQGANTTGQAPAPSPQTPHQPQTTSNGARGCSPRTSRHRNPKSCLPPRPLSCQPSVRPRPGSCHITILPRASRTTGGLWQEEAKSPGGEPQRHPARPRAPACPGAVPSPTPNLPPRSSTVLGSAPRRAGSRAGTTGTALPPHRVPLGRHLKGRRVGDGPARPARPLQGCPVASQRGRPGAGAGVGARRGAPEPSSEARRCTAETWEEPGVAFSLLSARFHGEHTLYSECHHFPWIVGQRERK